MSRAERYIALGLGVSTFAAWSALALRYDIIAAFQCALRGVCP